MKGKNDKIYGILNLSIILFIIVCSIIFSANAASAVDNTYYWTPSSGAIDSSGFTANWGNCNAQPTSYRITTLSNTGFTCNSDRSTTTSSGDQFLAINPIAYSSATQIVGKTGATFYLSSQRSGYIATYRFDLGYANSGTFTSLGYVTQNADSSSGSLYTIDLSSINGIVPSGAYLALRVSVTTSRGGRVYLGTDGGQTNSNSGRFYVNETVATFSEASVVDKTFYWIPSSGAIASSGFTASWGNCGALPTSYRITTLSSTGFTCNSDRLTRTTSGDQFLAIYPTAYSSDTQITGKTGATFYLSSQRSGYTATYRFDLGYAQGGTFTSLGYVTQSVTSSTGRSYTIDMSSITGTAPAGSYPALKVSVTTSQGGRVYLGTNGGATGSNSGRFYITETVTVPPASTYDVTIEASPVSSFITQGSNYTYIITVNNTGNTNGDYTLAVSDSDSTNFVTPSVLGRTSIYVPFGGSNTTTLKVTATSTASGGASDTTTVTATSIQDPSYNSSTTATTTVQSPVYSVNASIIPSSQSVQNGSQVQYTVTVQNTGNTADSYALSINNPNTADFTYSLGLNSTGVLIPGQSFSTAMTVTASTGAAVGSSHNQSVRVTGTSTNNSNNVITSVVSAPMQTGGKILVSANRYVVLDDPKTGSFSGTGFKNPSSSWNTDTITGVETTITMWAMLLDSNGMPLVNKNVNFTLKNPVGTNDYTFTKATDSNGLVNVTRDLNNKNYYGKWQIVADYEGLNQSTSFIYNWWGCGGGAGCNGHSSQSWGSGAAINSPYTTGHDTAVGLRSTHYNTANDCMYCHLSYNGQGSTPGMNTADRHSSFSCTDSNCHGSITQHRTNMVIGSCNNCHNRTAISEKSTLNGILSNYSTASTYHDQNSSIPCIICHGPMHNITKPDPTVGMWNNVTEDSHCTTCHANYEQHKGSVNCTLCHSQDIHTVQVFSQSAGYVNKGSTYQGDCTNCHQNASFFNTLKSNTRAGSYTGSNPPQVQIPLNHSNDPSAGQKWNNYWTAGTSGSAQLTACNYCHGSTQHDLNALGKPAQFDGNNVVGGTISNTTYWCSSCHWQGYTSGANTYNDMVNIFIALMVPPEITGHATYGANQNISGYFNHSGVAKDDVSCQGCHGGLTSSTNITGLLHNAGQGSSGGTDCKSCHDIGGSAPKEVDINVLKNSTHKNLNGALTDVNKACYACHGDGSAPSSGHPVNYKNPKLCDDCHTGSGNYSAPLVAEHNQNGQDVITNTTCDTCHDNNGMFLSNAGTNGMTTAYGHYIKDITSISTNPYQHFGPINTSNCIECHNNATYSNNASWGTPVNISTSTRRVHTETQTSQCDICHKDGNVTSLAIVDFHNASVQGGSGSCISCHSQPPSGTIRYNMTGAHDLHKAAGYGSVPETSCDYCHSTGGKNEAGHPNTNDNATVVTNVSASIATYNMNPASGNDDTCAGVSCHTNGISTGARVGTAIWNSSTAGVCTECHSTVPSGLPPTGNHTKHYTTEGYSCAECHGTNADSGTQLGHKTNALIDINFTNVTGSINTSKTCSVYCHSPNANDVKPKPTWNTSTVACGDCHSIPPTAFTTRNGNLHPTIAPGECDGCHGTGAINGTQAGHINGTIDTPAMTCTSCHSQPPSGTARYNTTGAHDLHKAAGYGSVPETSCNYCHSTGGKNEAGHPNTYDNATVVTNISAYIGSYFMNPATGKDDTCGGVSCHTNGLSAGAKVGTAIWNSSTAGVCTECHSTVPSGLPPTGNHTKHYTTVGYSCAECHGTNADSGMQPGHKTNALIDINFTNVTGSINTSKTCSVYCHSPNANDVKPKPTWNTSSVGCGDCHSIPPTAFTTRNGNLHPTIAPGECDGCHGTGAINGTQAGHINGAIDTSSGGADCISCHDVGGILGGGKQVNFTAMNNVDDIHKNLNSGAASPSGYSPANFKCWACHGSGNESASGHPSNYKTPYKCVNCHVSGAGNFTPASILTVSQHYWNGTNITTSSISSCYNCHNRTEMMVGSFDPDGAASIYGGANGGNNSVSHYGKKRNDMVNMDTTTYCVFCHNTTTNNATFYVSNFNNSVANHTSKESTPFCTTCHNNGRIHDINLSKPASTDTFCKNCHGPGGSAATNNKVEHKSLYCAECHANNTDGSKAGRDIHGIKFLQKDNTFTQTKTNAVDCTTCHQSNAVDSSLGITPIKVSNPLHHSDDILNGSKWGSYWTNQTGSCLYCHNDTKHSLTPLGRPLIWNPSYVLNSAISTGTNCADCHYKGDSNYGQMSAEFTGAGLGLSPEITNGSWNGKPGYYNHTLSDYTDSQCKSCHDKSGSMTVGQLMHNNSVGSAGGPDCKACHDIGGSAPAHVNFSVSAGIDALHSGLNRNATATVDADNKKCWACHGNGTQPISGHPSNYKTPYTCENCHVQKQGGFTPSTILEVNNHYLNGTNISTSVSCQMCHNKTEMMLAVYDPEMADNPSHYGKKRNDMASMDATTYCVFCHNTTTNNATFYVGNFNNTIINHTSSATTPLCQDCHNTGRLHDIGIAKPVSSDALCKNCHADRSEHKTLSCTECHANNTDGSKAGRDIHGIKFLQKDNTFTQTKTNAVDCTTCHQSNAVDSSLGITPIKVSNPLHHSDDILNGSKWGSYWTNQTGSCLYCHNDTKHSLTPLGRPLIWNPSYVLNSAISTGTNCADCHYKGDSNYGQMSAEFTGAGLGLSPEITNGSWNGKPDYYNHTLSDYTDSQCKSCHDKSGSTTVGQLTHNNYVGSAGGPDCKACHDAAGTAPKLINFSVANNSAHKNLNSEASSTVNAENKKCWACHGDGTQPSSGHPSKYKTPDPCEDCHTGSGVYGAPLAKEHIQNGSYVKTTAACILCHDNNGMTIDGGGIGTITHYIKNVTDTTTTPYGHSGTINTTDCIICHRGQYTGNASWGSPVNITTSLKRRHTETTNVQCDGCHKDNTTTTLANVDFHNASIRNFGGNCLDCHANAE